MWRLIFFLTLLPLSAQVFLATPRRCGTHFLIYSLEYLTQHRWIVQQGLEWNWFDLGSDPSLERYRHAHDLFRHTFFDPENDHLILLIRDYHEALIREFETLEAILEAIEKKETLYFENLELYTHWNPNLRLLVTYEELISHPEKTLLKVLNFLGEESSRLPAFLSDLDFHQKRLIRYYRRCGGSHTQGRDFHYHLKKFSPLEVKRLDRAIRDAYPHLWENYLKVYCPEKTESP